MARRQQGAFPDVSTFPPRPNAYFAHTVMSYDPDQKWRAARMVEPTRIEPTDGSTRAIEYISDVTEIVLAPTKADAIDDFLGLPRGKHRSLKQRHNDWTYARRYWNCAVVSLSINVIEAV